MTKMKKYEEKESEFLDDTSPVEMEESVSNKKDENNKNDEEK